MGNKVKLFFSLHNSLLEESNYHMECHTEMLFQMLNKSLHSIICKIFLRYVFYQDPYTVTTAMSDVFFCCSLYQNIKLITWLPSFMLFFPSPSKNLSC